MRWRRAARIGSRLLGGRGGGGGRGRGRQPAGQPGTRRGQRPAYRGDVVGPVTISYAPRADGEPDPGEVVWAWVPYEEDASQGKDRPVLVVGTSGDDLLALMLTSQDHDARPDDGRHWFDLGRGAWDSQGRSSEVRLDRVLRLDPAAVRREGAALDRTRFDAVVAAASGLHGW